MFASVSPARTSLLPKMIATRLDSPVARGAHETVPLDTGRS